MSDITDGFGNSWPRCDLGKKCGMHVVRPGHAACWCEDAKSEALLLMKENEQLRNELAKLNGGTRWQCKCGGTDCAGQRENAELRAALERWQRLAQLGLEDVVPEFMARTVRSIALETISALRRRPNLDSYVQVFKTAKAEEAQP